MNPTLSKIKKEILKNAIDDGIIVAMNNLAGVKLFKLISMMFLDVN